MLVVSFTTTSSASPTAPQPRAFVDKGSRGDAPRSMRPVDPAPFAPNGSRIVGMRSACLGARVAAPRRGRGRTPLEPPERGSGVAMPGSGAFGVGR